MKKSHRGTLKALYDEPFLSWSVFFGAVTRCREEVAVGRFLRTGSTLGAVRGPSDGRGWGLRQRWGRSWGWGLVCRGGGLGGWSAKTWWGGVDGLANLAYVTCRLRAGERIELAAHLPPEHAVGSGLSPDGKAGRPATPGQCLLQGAAPRYQRRPCWAGVRDEACKQLGMRDTWPAQRGRRRR